ncbi:MAG: bifunctional 4-hydroxy-2-oxoglutarate aldolase/2-dehydro-3-deoxy-phosphogluconate aldolase [Rhodospirillales bacterium]
MTDLKKILTQNRLVPVVILHDSAAAAPLCEALLAGGLSIVEITLRTEAALEGVHIAAEQFPEMTVGAGTVTNSRALRLAHEHGAQFCVSPGASAELRQAAKEAGLPFLPGAATASEIMANAESGFTLQKFFPAESAGGADFLRTAASLFPDVQFCPTGGINRRNAPDYFALENVIAVGGSWFVTAERIAEGDWNAVTRDVKDALGALWKS